MGRRALCLAALCCLWIVTGMHSFEVLLQSPKSITALTNVTTEIQCAVKQVHVEQYGVHWYRWHRETGNYEFIVYVSVLDKSTHNSTSAKERFTVSRDKFRRLDILKIKALQLSDSGTYYCAVVHASEMIFGEGTKLAVVDVVVQHTTRAAENTLLCGCESKDKPPKYPVKKPGTGLSCSIVIWAPLLAGAVILLISLAVIINHLHHFYRRYRRHFHKKLPK